MDGVADEVMVRVGEAMEAAARGDREAGRARLTAIWAEVGSEGDPFHRCAIAHQLADLQDDAAEELRWDTLALDAAGNLTDERVAAGGVASPARGFLPSLHLNLADVHLRLGQLERSAVHVALGRSALDALPADGYRTMIEEALDRVESACRAPR